MLRRSPLNRRREKPRRNEGRISQARIKPKGRIVAHGAEKRHVERIAAMPCVVTGSLPVVVHHIMHMKGKLRRRDHRFIVPLIPELHNMGNDSVHALGGEAAFLKKHRFDLVAWAIKEWEKTCAGC